MGQRLISLAAGTVLDIDPETAVGVAAEAGFGGVGLWFDPLAWTDSMTERVRRRLDATGMVALDIEPVILGRGNDSGERMIDVAAALGVHNVLMASGRAERGAVVERLGALCNYAASVHPQVRIVLEFLPIFSVATLDQAASIVTEVASPIAGVLVDTLHLARSGGRPADLAQYDRSMFPYLQLADATSEPADPSLAGLTDEALYGRLLPGEGVLPLVEVLTTVPDVAISVELRSRVLVESFPDPLERSRAVYIASRRTVDAAVI